MGDKITDLSKEFEVPPLPPKTYQWEDIRRQKLEGRYPWTHLHKPPFNDENWNKIKDYEYEPVIPMDNYKTQSSFIKITLERENTTTSTEECVLEIPQDKNHLRVPDKNEYEDEDDDDSSEFSEDASEEITAAELQLRLEEKYFRQSPASSKHEYELTETRSVSPALILENGQTSSKLNTPGLQRKMQLQADKIKQKFKNFKDQISREHVENSPRMKRKNDVNVKLEKSRKKNKFNFRNCNAKMPSITNVNTPQTTHSSFLSLPLFSRSRSSSMKDRERKRSLSSEADTTKKRFGFNFSTYPRSIFGKKKILDDKEEKSPMNVEPKSAPTSPTLRRSPFPPRWISKLTMHQKDDEKVNAKHSTNKDKTKETIVQESVFISLHEDKQLTATPETVTQSEDAQKKMKIDNENFIFISLHEERFPEKLREAEKKLNSEELEIEKQIKQAQTARKFHNMLKRLEIDRKFKARRAAEQDDKPEPVIITEITNDEDNLDGDTGIQETVQNKVEIQEEEEYIKANAGNEPQEKLKCESQDEKIKEPVKLEKIDKTQQSILNSNRDTEPRDCKTNTYEPIKPLREELSKTHAVLVTPPKTPRKKSRKSDLEKKSKELLFAFQDSSFNDLNVLNEREIITKTYIQASLEEVSIPLESVKQEQTINQFKEYEKALESCKRYSSFESENQCYTSNNTLARLETPVPPNRPSRGKTLMRKKRGKTADSEDKENVYGFELTNQSYNTFPVTKPAKPRRKFKKRRTYSNSTNNTDNTDIKNLAELEDDTINKNIINSKQLSISFLPLTSNVVGEPITEYNLRETSSMVHLNLKDPPLPPKRRRGQCRTETNFNYHSLPNQKYPSKRSTTSSEIPENLEINVNDDELEYVDDDSSTNLDSDSPPKRPNRKRSAVPSMVDEDRTSREIESLPSEKSIRDDNDSCYSDFKDVNTYAVIDKPSSFLHSKTKTNERNSQPSTSLRKSRRISEFFTLPRIRVHTNYILPISKTLNRRRLPSPIRPPRRTRSFRQPVYTNDEDNLHAEHEIKFEEEQLNFNLATEEDIEHEDSKNLQADDVLEKMKSRPLPPPPRPTRKPREIEDKNIQSDDYNHCNKNAVFFENKITNGVNEKTTIEENISKMTEHKCEMSSKNLFTNECSNFNTRSEHNQKGLFLKSESNQRSYETSTIEQEPIFRSLRCNGCIEPNQLLSNRASFFSPSAMVTQSQINKLTEEHEPKLTKQSESNSTKPLQNVRADPCLSKPNACIRNKRNLDVVTASRLDVIELNVGKLSVAEIESSKFTTSNVESSSMQSSKVKGNADNFILNSIDFSTQHCSGYITHNDDCQIVQLTDQRDCTPSDETQFVTNNECQTMRERVSSVISEIGSDNESNTPTDKVVRPSRRKQSPKKEQSSVSPTVPQSSRATLAELITQILQICHSSVGQAIHSLLEQLIPEDREKRNEVQTAIWVITIVVAGCLMLGLQSNEKIVHHHHWDFHFPPPH